jgi:hypothetical protein
MRRRTRRRQPTGQACGAAAAAKAPRSHVNQPPHPDSEPPPRPNAGGKLAGGSGTEGNRIQGQRQPAPFTINPCCSILGGVGQRPGVHGAQPVGRQGRARQASAGFTNQQVRLSRGSAWISHEGDRQVLPEAAPTGSILNSRGNQLCSAHCETSAYKLHRRGDSSCQLKKRDWPRSSSLKTAAGSR